MIVVMESRRMSAPKLNSILLESTVVSIAQCSTMGEIQVALTIFGG